MNERIIRNRIRCKKCGDIIESYYCHDYKECSCGSCAVDGGHQYLRRCFVEIDGFEELSEVRVISEEESKLKMESMKRSLMMQDTLLENDCGSKNEKEGE